MEFRRVLFRSDIKSWQQLKGRTVCLSEGGRYVGALTRQYGAVEIVFKAPADSLLALRTGGCDAAVHDDVMLKELLKLPEWKKFSASLPPGPAARSEEHTSELQSLMRISYAVFCLKNKNKKQQKHTV